MSVTQLQFPTSGDADGIRTVDGPPDRVVYLELTTDADDGHRGVGLVVTTADGRGVHRAAVEALRPVVVGRDVEPTLADLGAFGRELARPRRGDADPGQRVARGAVGVVLDALWDLRAKREGLPLWRLLAALTPEQIVDLVDFRYLTDAVTRDEASALLRAAEPGRAQRREQLEQVGYPAAATGPGRFGDDDATLERWCRDAVATGVAVLEIEVGGDVDDDVRRLGVARAAVGPDVRLAVDARQRWDVDEAVTWLRRLQPFDLAWVTEPTSADDVVGHATIARAVAPTPVATGEHLADRVLAKQLLQTGAAALVQLDATRVGGVHEGIAVLLLAARHGVRVCPRTRGPGSGGIVAHLAMFDAVAVSGRREDGCLEVVDPLHEHVRTPVVVRDGRYVAPSAPGAGTELRPESVRDATDGPGQRVLVRTRLRPGEESRYEALHATIPDALAEGLRAAGVSQWRIHRDGVDLFHVVDVRDHRAMRTALADDPVNVAWQALVNPLLAEPDDYSGRDDGLPLVWSLV